MLVLSMFALHLVIETSVLLCVCCISSVVFSCSHHLAIAFVWFIDKSQICNIDPNSGVSIPQFSLFREFKLIATLILSSNELFYRVVVDSKVRAR